MRTLRFSLCCCAVAASALLASCVHTKPDQGRYGGQDRRDEAPSREVRKINQLIREAGERIERAERSRQLDEREVRSLRRELREVRDLETRMSRDGWVDRRELDLLAKRVDDLHRHVTKEIRD